MTPLGVFARGTPGHRTPESGMLRIADDGRSSLVLLRALALLVTRLGDAEDAVRDALRQVTARSRDGALLLRIQEGGIVLGGAPVADETIAADALLVRLLERLAFHRVGTITVREGAAPGELLTLARVIADTRPVADTDQRELLRTWSILVTPATEPVIDDGAASASVNALTRFAAARSDAAAVAAVASLMDLMDDAEARGDAVAVEGVARACLAQLRVVGGGGGRLAIEQAVRRLLRPRMLQLLATRLPWSHDGTALLQLFARAGETGVQCLLSELLVADDSVARRAYFDGIVAMDVGAALLFEALHDPRWFVVRNAAALLGEMAVDHSDTELLQLLSHEDERIRFAAARALVRLRTPAALSGLQRAIEDGNAEVRRLSAAAYGIAGSVRGNSRPAAGPLAAALDRETDDDVALEMLSALGRLGSSHAVQRLLRITLPASSERAPGEAAPPRDTWVRIAALEALVHARGHAMIPAIESLMGDADTEVAAAAVRLYGTVAS